jgi:hypothetical protein
MNQNIETIYLQLLKYGARVTRCYQTTRLWTDEIIYVIELETSAINPEERWSETIYLSHFV